MSFNKGDYIWWSDPDNSEDSDCSQYAVVEEYAGDGIYRCTTAKGGELEALDTEMRRCTDQECRLVKAASALYDDLCRLRTKAIKPGNFDFEKHLEALATAL